VLGFLSVSTIESGTTYEPSTLFQSRAGFSECLDLLACSNNSTMTGFNPVLGFLSVSTVSNTNNRCHCGFQSRAGFSECLDF